MQRRKFIKLIGGGIVVAAGAAGAGVLAKGAIFGVPDFAVAAWKGPEPELEIRRFVLSYAILAPNPHNLQPWMADLRTPDEITLRLDPDRLLPATDPFGRQILMGAGAFLELMALAAAERGYRTEIVLFPEGEPGTTIDGRAFARVRLVPQPEVRRDPLFKRVLDRRTDRRAFDPGRLISAGDAELLRAAVTSLPVRFGLAGSAGGPQSDATRLAEIRKIAREAWRVEVTTEPTMMELMRLTRFGSTEIGVHRDGVAITSPIAVILEKTGLFDPRQVSGSGLTDHGRASRGLRCNHRIDPRLPLDRHGRWRQSQTNRRRPRLCPRQSCRRLRRTGDATQRAVPARVSRGGRPVSRDPSAA